MERMEENKNTEDFYWKSLEKEIAWKLGAQVGE
jgi:hypothetical protein